MRGGVKIEDVKLVYKFQITKSKPYFCKKSFFFKETGNIDYKSNTYIGSKVFSFGNLKIAVVSWMDIWRVPGNTGCFKFTKKERKKEEESFKE